MKAELILNPWVSDTLPKGLTLNKEYEVIEVFNSNSFDKYFRIIDDDDLEQAWNSECFKVTVKRPIDIINECINLMESMTQEEFDEIVKRKGINEKEYSIEKYTDDTFHIILPYNN